MILWNETEGNHHTVLVMSYSTLRSDLSTIEACARMIHCVILDEVHIIRNPNTSTAKACFKLGSQSAFRIALSGTPIHNGSRIYGVSFVLFFLGISGRLPTSSACTAPWLRCWSRRSYGCLALWKAAQWLWATMDEEDGLAHDGNQDKDESETWKKLENLYGVLRPFVMRRSKGDVLRDLPDKVIQDFALQCTDVQGVYSALEEARLNVKSEKVVHVFQMIRLLLMACTHPLLPLDLPLTLPREILCFVISRGVAGNEVAKLFVES